MDVLIDLLRQCDITTILVILVSFYFYDKKMEKRFEKIDQRFEKIDQRFEKIDQRFERLEQKIIDIDKRLIAVETMMHMKDCCMLKDDRVKQKAQ